MHGKLQVQDPGRQASRRGFTLPEVLVTVAIIGTMSMATTVALSSVRVKARDLRRMSDASQFRTALELYFQAHGGYPNDGVPGPGGIALGTKGYDALSDAGFGHVISGTVFMEGMPKNPAPFGSQYVYRALNADGSDCDKPACASYAILFSLEQVQGDLAAGPHAMTPGGVKKAEGFSSAALASIQAEISNTASAQARVDSFVTTSADRIISVVNSEPVKQANELVVAPVIAVAAAANVAFGTSQFGQYLFFFLTQPVSLFGRKKRKSWGTVFNAISHMPVDLAIVRLRSDVNGRLLQSTVTDSEGRYSFLVPAGNYRIEVAKVGVVFPSVIDIAREEDGALVDLYHGNRIAVEAGGTLLTPNIPVDPDVADLPDEVILRSQSHKLLVSAVALVSPVLGGIVFVMRPTPFVGLLFVAEVVVYFLFLRLAETSALKNWGTVFHQVTQVPVPKAIVRIFSQRFNKLLEAQVTDLFGRYHFRVMDNVFYLTVSKNGFRKTETEPIDLVGGTSPVIIASDLPLAPISGGIIVASRKPVAADGRQKPSVLVAPKSFGTPAVRDAHVLPDSMLGPAEPEKTVEKNSGAPLVVPEVPDFLRGAAEVMAQKKEGEPEAPPAAPPTPDFFLEKSPDDEKKTPPSSAWFRDS